MGLKLNFLKNDSINVQDIKKYLDEQRDHFREKIDKIRTEDKNNPGSKFHKFSYLFHDTMSKVLKSTGSATMDELVDNMEDLSTKNYYLVKMIKDKEDLLLKEKDKTKFSEVNKELKKLYYEKNYFSVIESNIYKHGLVADFRDIVSKINWMEFSGDEISSRELDDVIERAMGYVRTITDLQDEELFSDKQNNDGSGLLENVMGKLNIFKGSVMKNKPESSGSGDNGSDEPPKPQGGQAEDKVSQKEEDDEAGPEEDSQASSSQEQTPVSKPSGSRPPVSKPPETQGGTKTFSGKQKQGSSVSPGALKKASPEKHAAPQQQSRPETGKISMDPPSPPKPEVAAQKQDAGQKPGQENTPQAEDSQKVTAAQTADTSQREDAPQDAADIQEPQSQSQNIAQGDGNVYSEESMGKGFQKAQSVDAVQENGGAEDQISDLEAKHDDNHGAGVPKSPGNPGTGNPPAQSPAAQSQDNSHTVSKAAQASQAPPPPSQDTAKHGAQQDEYQKKNLIKLHKDKVLVLTNDERELIKSKVGEEYFSSYVEPVLKFLEVTPEGYGHLHEIKEAFLRKGWPQEHVDYTIALVQKLVEYKLKN